MKKQGFTLIELMVVIVIMGILAAVAVPKLFGMIAKSKASEIGPAAGEYIKLQDAYVSEANMAGTWTLIGYKMDSNQNFTYTPEGLTAKTSVSEITNVIAWQAQNNVAMNECAASGCKWQLKLNGSTDGNGVTYAPGWSASAVALTPSFEKLGTGTAYTISAQ